MVSKDFQIDGLNRASSTHKFAGGKGINVSRVLQTLNVASTALGFVGGFPGNFIKDTLLNSNIATDFVTVDEASSTVTKSVAMLLFNNVSLIKFPGKPPTNPKAVDATFNVCSTLETLMPFPPANLCVDEARFKPSIWKSFETIILLRNN